MHYHRRQRIQSRASSNSCQVTPTDRSNITSNSRSLLSFHSWEVYSIPQASNLRKLYSMYRLTSSISAFQFTILPTSMPVISLKAFVKPSTISWNGCTLNSKSEHNGGLPFIPNGLNLSSSSFRQSNTQWLKKYWLTVDCTNLPQQITYSRYLRTGSNSIKVYTSRIVRYLLMPPFKDST